MKQLDKGGKYECCRHWNSESQKNFQSPSPVRNLGSPNKMPKKSHSNGSCTVHPQMWSKAPCKTESKGLQGSGSLVEKPNPLENIVVQKSHDEFYILISSLELQKTACLTTCSSFPWLEVLWVMCSNGFQIMLLCTNHTLVKPILNLA